MIKIILFIIGIYIGMFLGLLTAATERANKIYDYYIESFLDEYKKKEGESKNK